MGNAYTVYSSFRSCFRSRKEARILMQGLDAAGKTSVLYRIKLGEVVTTIPTIGFNVETIEHKDFKLITWDVGGRDKIRPLYRHYYQNTDVLIFIIDSTDRERLKDIKDEMESTLQEDELRDTLLAVFANKQDLTNAMSLEEITEKMDLYKTLRTHFWAIFPTSAKTGDGLYEALDWIAANIGKKNVKDKITAPIKDTVHGVKEMAKDSQRGLSYLLDAWCSLKRAFSAD